MTPREESRGEGGECERSGPRARPRPTACGVHTSSSATRGADARGENLALGTLDECTGRCCIRAELARAAGFEESEGDKAWVRRFDPLPRIYCVTATIV